MKSGFIKSAAEAAQFPPPHPTEFMVVGRSNCGKSSLLNALMQQKDLVRTSRTPGRTQLANFFHWGAKHAFVDLPGYGYSQTGDQKRSTWRPLVESCLEREAIRVALFLTDIRRDFAEEDALLLDFLSEKKSVVIILTKADKLNRKELGERLRHFEEALQMEASSFYVVSSLTGDGVGQLRKDLLQSSST